MKYQAFRTGVGGRVRWSERGGSLASAANLTTLATSADNQRRSQLRRTQSLAEVSSGRRQEGATVPAPSQFRPEGGTAAGPAAAGAGSGTPAEAGTTSQDALEAGNAQRRISGERLREVTLIWNALLERQRQRLDPLSLSPLPGIAEESESRKSSLRSSIDLSELGRPAADGVWVSPASARHNTANNLS